MTMSLSHCSFKSVARWPAPILYALPAKRFLVSRIIMTITSNALSLTSATLSFPKEVTALLLSTDLPFQCPCSAELFPPPTMPPYPKVFFSTLIRHSTSPLFSLHLSLSLFFVPTMIISNI